MHAASESKSGSEDPDASRVAAGWSSAFLATPCGQAVQAGLERDLAKLSEIILCDEPTPEQRLSIATIGLELLLLRTYLGMKSFGSDLVYLEKTLCAPIVQQLVAYRAEHSGNATKSEQLTTCDEFLEVFHGRVGLKKDSGLALIWLLENRVSEVRAFVASKGRGVAVKAVTTKLDATKMPFSLLHILTIIKERASAVFHVLNPLLEPMHHEIDAVIGKAGVGVKVATDTARAVQAAVMTIHPAFVQEEKELVYLHIQRLIEKVTSPAVCVREVVDVRLSHVHERLRVLVGDGVDLKAFYRNDLLLSTGESLTSLQRLLKDKLTAYPGQYELCQLQQLFDNWVLPAGVKPVPPVDADRVRGDIKPVRLGSRSSMPLPRLMSEKEQVAEALRRSMCDLDISTDTAKTVTTGSGSEASIYAKMLDILQEHAGEPGPAYAALAKVLPMTLDSRGGKCIAVDALTLEQIGALHKQNTDEQLLCDIAAICYPDLSTIVTELRRVTKTTEQSVLDRTPPCAGGGGGGSVLRQASSLRHLNQASADRQDERDHGGSGGGGGTRALRRSNATIFDPEVIAAELGLGVIDPEVRAIAAELGMSVDDYLAALAAVSATTAQVAALRLSRDALESAAGGCLAPITQAPSPVHVDPTHGLIYNQIYGILEDNAGDAAAAKVAFDALDVTKMHVALLALDESGQRLCDIANLLYPDSTLAKLLTDMTHEALGKKYRF